MIRLMIADDHALMREGLRQLFSLFEDIELVGEAANGTQAMSRLNRGGVDLLLMDMCMPGPSGENLVARIRALHPRLPILVLSMFSESMVAQRALKAGANGYLTKGSDPDVLLTAVRAVAAGDCYVDSVIARELASEPGSQGKTKPKE